MAGFSLASGFSVGQDSAVPTNWLALAGGRIRLLREQMSVSQEQLGRLAGGINKETVNRIERGENTTLEKIDAVARAAGTTLTELFSEDGPDLLRQGRTRVPIDAVRDEEDLRRGYELDSIPVIAEGEATPGGMQWTNTITRHAVIEYMDRPPQIQDADAYGLLVIGDSMVPVFRKGQRLVASPNTPIDDGDEVYVQLKSGARLIKLAFRVDGGWRLESVNPAYEPKTVTDDDVESIHPIVLATRKPPGRRVIDEQTGKRIG